MRGIFRDQKCFMKVVNANKTTFADQARNEISVYKHLENLRGKIIPRLLGHGNDAGLQEVLFLEDCGDHSDTLTEDDSVSLLVQLHALDVLHVARRNIVRRMSESTRRSTLG